MDTRTAPTASSARTEGRPSRWSARQVWQVPVFILGALALVLAYLARPLVHPDPVRQFQHDLERARQLLQHHTGDRQQALQAAQRAVDGVSNAPDRAGEAYFLLGTAHLRLASHAPPPLAAEHWRLARQYLEEAQKHGVPPEDAGRLRFRLGVVGFHTHDDPQHVLALLKGDLDYADDLAEAYSLLTQAYLNLNPPNYKEALGANEMLRMKVPRVPEELLAPAKLAGAKLLLRLNRPEEARKTLEKISEQAPAAVLSEARMLLAGLYQQDGKWAEASELWKAVLGDGRVPPAEPGGVLYNLGVCCRQLEQMARAAEAWVECLEHGKGDEVPAAALGLAELYLHWNPNSSAGIPARSRSEASGSPEKALGMLARTVAKVRKAADWSNSLVDLAHLRELFENAVTAFRQAHRFELAVQAAELYERVAEGTRAPVLRADLSEEWARYQQSQGREAKDPETRKKDETAAGELFRQAAEAHTEVARLTQPADQRDERLRRSALCSFEGQDYKRAAEKFVELLKGETNYQRLGEGWFLVGESYRNLEDQESATKAYFKCLECTSANPTRFTFRARYQLAMNAIDEGDIDNATGTLDQNIKDLRAETTSKDTECLEKSLFALCTVLYTRSNPCNLQNYRRIITQLEGSLDRFPPTPEAVRARYQLADSYRHLAGPSQVKNNNQSQMSPEAKEHYERERKRWLGLAVEEFSKLEELLKDPEARGLLSIRQQVEVPFIIASCQADLGLYDLALKKYDELATYYGKRPEALMAKAGGVKCCAMKLDNDQARRRLDDIRDGLPDIVGLSEAERAEWRDWVARASKPLPPPGSRPQQRPPMPTVVTPDPGRPAEPAERGPDLQSLESRGPVTGIGPLLPNP